MLEKLEKVTVQYTVCVTHRHGEILKKYIDGITLLIDRAKYVFEKSMHTY
jgi:hypothetical protein